jgi:hypothetical protein
LDNLQKPFVQAAQRAMKHVESCHGARFVFRLMDVTETVPSYIKRFSPLNDGAREICTLMQENIPQNSPARNETLCAAFNLLVEMAQERGFGAGTGDLTLTINSPAWIPVFKPLVLQKKH